MAQNLRHICRFAGVDHAAGRAQLQPDRKDQDEQKAELSVLIAQLAYMQRYV
jgi:hypothetical protein